MYVFEGLYQDQRVFACLLHCTQCTGTRKDRQRCTRRSCIGTPYCWMHLLIEKKLRIKTSTIAGAGKGLFAMDKHAPANAVIFPKGRKVIVYDGEIVNQDTLNARYGQFTAPYAIHEFGTTIDAACRRGVAALSNHSSRNANARLAFSRANKEFMLIATRSIKNGDEILCNYGRAYQHDDGMTHKTTQRRMFHA